MVFNIRNVWSDFRSRQDHIFIQNTKCFGQNNHQKKSLMSFRDRTLIKPVPRTFCFHMWRLHSSCQQGLVGQMLDRVIERGGRTRAVFYCLSKQWWGHLECEASASWNWWGSAGPRVRYRWNIICGKLRSPVDFSNHVTARSWKESDGFFARDSCGPKWGVRKAWWEAEGRWRVPRGQQDVCLFVWSHRTFSDMCSMSLMVSAQIKLKWKLETWRYTTEYCACVWHLWTLFSIAGGITLLTTAMQTHREAYLLHWCMHCAKMSEDVIKSLSTLNPRERHCH